MILQNVMDSVNIVGTALKIKQTLRPPGNGAPTPKPGSIRYKDKMRSGAEEDIKLQPSWNGATNPEQDAADTI